VRGRDLNGERDAEEQEVGEEGERTSAYTDGKKDQQAMTQ
jgi:hypothetical protein